MNQIFKLPICNKLVNRISLIKLYWFILLENFEYQNNYLIIINS